MSKNFILLTGATGFLGSELAEELLNNNYIVVATKRTFSDLWRCRGFEDKIMGQINKFDEIVTIEDHLLDCGFGSWLRESIVIPESHIKITNKALSLDVIGKVGTENYLLKVGGFNI